MGEGLGVDRDHTARGRISINLLNLFGVPDGIRTRVTAVKGRCPRPLDDGDATLARLHNSTLRTGFQSCACFFSPDADSALS
jgi:hypothetical protein